jgi:hypothetical protein
LSIARTGPLVAIHQPNFFPWLGYFDKIARADVFVFLDGVGFPRGSWVNRVRLNIQGEARWITCPVKRATLAGQIAGVEIDDTKDWRTKLLKTLDANYRRAPNFDFAMRLVEPLVRNSESELAAFNINAITTIAGALGIVTRFLRQSDLNVSGAASEMLVSVVQAAGGTAYLMGGGASGYHDNAAFAEAGVGVQAQAFHALPYGPPEHFLPGLSVIDYLMYDGRPLRGGAAES